MTRLVAPVVISTLTSVGAALSLERQAADQAAEPVRPYAGCDVAHIGASPRGVVHLLASRQHADHSETRGKSRDRECRGEGGSERIG